MRISVRHVLRFLVLVAVVAALPALLSPISPSGTPYVSALSNLTDGVVLAATHCSDKACGSFSGPCVSAPGYLCVGGGGSRQCFTRLCQ